MASAALQAGLDGADHDLQQQHDHHQVPQHLDHGHDAGRLGQGVMSPKPTVENTDGEVEGVVRFRGSLNAWAWRSANTK